MKEKNIKLRKYLKKLKIKEKDFAGSNYQDVVKSIGILIDLGYSFKQIKIFIKICKDIDLHGFNLFENWVLYFHYHIVMLNRGY